MKFSENDYNTFNERVLNIQFDALLKANYTFMRRTAIMPLQHCKSHLESVVHYDFLSAKQLQSEDHTVKLAIGITTITSA